MFRKLLKYEWQANARLFWILSAAALGVALLGGFVLLGANYIADHTSSNVAIALAVPGMYLLATFCLLVLAGYAASVSIINLVRFYKSKFTDEGYLTFTLPVKVSHIYLSTYVNILLWWLLSGTIVICCVLLSLGIGFSDVLMDALSVPDFRQILNVLAEDIGSLREELQSTLGYGLHKVLAGLIVVLSPLHSISMIMCCMTVGSVLVKKHKILVSIGVYYAANMITRTITSVLTSVLTLILVDKGSFILGYNAIYGVQLLLMIGVIVGSYFLSIHLMQKRLNLP